MIQALPVEILEEILCRLPTKDLVRVSRVCHFWHDLIISDELKEVHQQQSPPYHVRTCINFS